MSHLQHAGRLLWRGFTQRQQVAIVRRVASRRGAELSRRYANVLAVGVGYRTRRGRRYTAEVCLGFLVDKKRVRPRGKAVPRFIRTFIMRRGRRSLCLIPTDLEERGKGRPHQSFDLSGGVVARGPHGSAPRAKGAACCLVREKGTRRRYLLLGCHHVFARSLNPGLVPQDPSEISHRHAGRLIGTLFDFSPLNLVGRPCLDAALASVNDPSWLSPFFGGNAPTTVGDGITLPKGCRIYTPRGSIEARFVKEWHNIPLPYRRFGTVVIRMAYQFRADTLPGDSGSPVLDMHGRLYGMHFWGSDPPGTAYAIPSFVLFRAGLFRVDIELVA